MFEGHYKRWNPIPELEGIRMNCEAIHDDWEGFRIWLARDVDGRMLIVDFGDSVMYHAKLPEWVALAEVNQGGDQMAFPHVFWKVEESALVAAFHKQSCETTGNYLITHYAFLSSNETIHVLATEEPKFKRGTDA